MCCTGLSGLHYPGTGEINADTPGTADSALYFPVCVDADSPEWKPTVMLSICSHASIFYLTADGHRVVSLIKCQRCGAVVHHQQTNNITTSSAKH